MLISGVVMIGCIACLRWETTAGDHGILAELDVG